MNLIGTPDSIFAALYNMGYRDARVIVERVGRRIERKPKREIADYQAAALYALTQEYAGHRGACILEIGTALGFSASILAEAAPEAEIVTLNPREDEVAIARRNLAMYPKCEAVMTTSRDYLAWLNKPISSRINIIPPKYDLIFVDGDHARVRDDLPYWNWLAVGGVMVFHDFSPAGTYRECPPVWDALIDFAAWLGRIDVQVFDERCVGMAGFVKRADDPRWEGVGG